MYMPLKLPISTVKVQNNQSSKQCPGFDGLLGDKSKGDLMKRIDVVFLTIREVVDLADLHTKVGATAIVDCSVLIPSPSLPRHCYD
jgi:hypothetical protein